MKITDPLYGEFEITEPVILELLESPSVERLKGLYQYGAPPEIYPHFISYTRFEHSQGVMLLLRRLGTSLEEQVAGLLHDVSHPAFSHVIDLVFGDPVNETLQDTVHKDFFSQSELPAILLKYGLNPERIADYETFTLLEQPAPELCADRIDYSLREFSRWADPEGVPLMVVVLRVRDGRIVFGNRETAERFAQIYLKCQMEHWACPDTVIRYELLGRAVKRAIALGTLTREDLFTLQDREALERLHNSHDVEIGRILDLLNGAVQLEHLAKPPGRIRIKKFRYVDPGFLENGSVLRLSEAKPEFAQLVETKHIENTKGVLVPTVL